MSKRTKLAASIKLATLFLSAAIITPTAVCAQTRPDSINYSYGTGQYPNSLKSKFFVKNGRVYSRTIPDKSWQDISYLFNGENHVGFGEITAFDAFEGSGEGDPYLELTLVRGGKVYYGYALLEAPSVINWEEIDDSEFEGTGSGKIYSYNSAMLTDGPAYFLARGGRLYRARGYALPRNWEDITSLFDRISDPAQPITAFQYEAGENGDSEQYLARGGKVLQGTHFGSLWIDISPSLAGVGQSGISRVTEPLYKRVMVLEYTPKIGSEEKPLWQVLHDKYPTLWYNPRVLEFHYIQSLERASSQYVQYSVAEHKIIDGFPPFADGVAPFTESEYLSCTSTYPYTCRDDGKFDYERVLREHKVCEKANAGEIDELWIIGMQFSGTWEANMAGPGAFFTNGAPVGKSSCNVKLNIMGFVYEREPERMLEDMGHRVEGTIQHKLGGQWRNTYGPPPNSFPTDASPLERFTARGFDPTTAACGNMHGSLNTPGYDPNNRWGYDYTNPNVERNSCDDWENYPNFTGATTENNCQKWTCSDRGWHMYWLGKIPVFKESDQDPRRRALRNNWWLYVLDWDRANR